MSLSVWDIGLDYVAFRLGHWAGLCHIPSGTTRRIILQSVRARTRRNICSRHRSTAHRVMSHSVWGIAPDYVTFPLGQRAGLSVPESRTHVPMPVRNLSIRESGHEFRNLSSLEVPIE